MRDAFEVMRPHLNLRRPVRNSLGCPAASASLLHRRAPTCVATKSRFCTALIRCLTCAQHETNARQRSGARPPNQGHEQVLPRNDQATHIRQAGRQLRRLLLLTASCSLLLPRARLCRPQQPPPPSSSSLPLPNAAAAHAAVPLLGPQQAPGVGLAPLDLRRRQRVVVGALVRRPLQAEVHGHLQMGGGAGRTEGGTGAKSHVPRRPAGCPRHA